MSIPLINDDIGEMWNLSEEEWMEIENSGGGEDPGFSDDFWSFACIDMQEK